MFKLQPFLTPNCILKQVMLTQALKIFLKQFFSLKKKKQHFNSGAKKYFKSPHKNVEGNKVSSHPRSPVPDSSLQGQTLREYSGISCQRQSFQVQMCMCVFMGLQFFQMQLCECVCVCVCVSYLHHH